MNDPNPLPQQPAPVTAGAAPWWTSPQFKGLIVTFVMAFIHLVDDLTVKWFPKFAAYLASVTSAQVLSIVDDITAVGVAGGILWAMIQRARSPVQPLKMTQAAADNDPRTLALIDTQTKMRAANIPLATEAAAARINTTQGTPP